MKHLSYTSILRTAIYFSPRYTYFLVRRKFSDKSLTLLKATMLKFMILILTITGALCFTPQIQIGHRPVRLYSTKCETSDSKVERSLKLCNSQMSSNNFNHLLKSAALSLFLSTSLIIPNGFLEIQAANAASPSSELNDAENFKVLRVGVRNSVFEYFCQFIEFLIALSAHRVQHQLKILELEKPSHVGLSWTMGTSRAKI